MRRNDILIIFLQILLLVIQLITKLDWLWIPNIMITFIVILYSVNGNVVFKETSKTPTFNRNAKCEICSCRQKPRIKGILFNFNKRNETLRYKCIVCGAEREVHDV